MSGIVRRFEAAHAVAQNACVVVSALRIHQQRELRERATMVWIEVEGLAVTLLGIGVVAAGVAHHAEQVERRGGKSLCSKMRFADRFRFSEAPFIGQPLGFLDFVP
jgi:hypothetical protein